MYKDQNGKEYYATTKRDEIECVAERTRMNIMSRFVAAAGLVVFVTIIVVLVNAF